MSLRPKLEPIFTPSHERWFAWRPVTDTTGKTHWLRWMYRDIWRSNSLTVVVGYMTPEQFMINKLKGETHIPMTVE